MPPLIDRDSLAGDVVVAAVLFTIAAELAATFAGRLRDESAGRFRLFRGSLQEMLLLRRPGEEAELREGLGEAYTGYAHSTARLVPGL